jgi:hypothetical protein
VNILLLFHQSAIIFAMGFEGEAETARRCTTSVTLLLSSVIEFDMRLTDNVLAHYKY